jgi:putative hydrolase of the HAD superfamily
VARGPRAGGRALTGRGRFYDRGVAVRTVIFDWGGTLTPWHSIDHAALWHAVCARHYPPAAVADLARAIHQAELAVWRDIERSQHSATLAHVFERAGVSAPEALLASYFAACHLDRG